MIDPALVRAALLQYAEDEWGWDSFTEFKPWQVKSLMFLA